MEKSGPKQKVVEKRWVFDPTKHCPLVKDPPSDKCYVVKLDSLSIPYIIEYCAENYSECEIYKKYSSQK